MGNIHYMHRWCSGYAAQLQVLTLFNVLTFYFSQKRKKKQIHSGTINKNDRCYIFHLWFLFSYSLLVSLHKYTYIFNSDQSIYALIWVLVILTRACVYVI